MAATLSDVLDRMRKDAHGVKVCLLRPCLRGDSEERALSGADLA